MSKKKPASKKKPDIPCQPSNVVELPQLGEWSAGITLDNPKDSYPTWPLHPFDQESEAVNYAHWRTDGEDDLRQRCYPRREHLASFRRWEWNVSPHGLEWRKWRAHLTGTCGLRHSELAGLSVLDICDSLDHTKIPNEASHLAKSLREVAVHLRRLDAQDTRVRYMTSIIADLLSKGHGLQHPLQVIGVSFSGNGPAWFFKVLAKHLDLPVSTSRVEIVKRLADAVKADQKALAGSGQWSEAMPLKVITCRLKLKDARSRSVKPKLEHLGSELRKVGRQSYQVRLDTLQQPYRDKFKA